MAIKNSTADESIYPNDAQDIFEEAGFEQTFEGNDALLKTLRGHSSWCRPRPRWDTSASFPAFSPSPAVPEKSTFTGLTEVNELQ